jgi:hypothetical protein
MDRMLQLELGALGKVINTLFSLLDGQSLGFILHVPVEHLRGGVNGDCYDRLGRKWVLWLRTMHIHPRFYGLSKFRCRQERNWEEDAV